MKLNITKCIFGMTSGHFLGFMISHRGIEANPDKVEAIQVINLPYNIKTLHSCIGKIVALGHFLSQCFDKCAPLFEGLKLGKKFNATAWIVEYEEELECIKTCLKEVPILSPPIPGEEWYLYIATSNTTVSSMLVRNADKVLKHFYFVSLH